MTDEQFSELKRDIAEIRAMLLSIMGMTGFVESDVERRVGWSKEIHQHWPTERPSVRRADDKHYQRP